jgi:CysZ protein
VSNARAQGVLAGARHVLHGFKLVTAPGVRGFVIMPLLINIAVVGIALLAIGSAVDFALEHYLGNWPQWLQRIIWWLCVTLAAVSVFFTFSILANIIASPFNGMLSEAVERHLNPALSDLEFSWQRLLDDIPRTLAAELRKLAYIALRALPLVVLTLIPGLNLAAPALWLLFGAWMLSLEYIDFPLGNHRAVFPRVLEEMRARRRLTLGFGASMTILTMIPGLNFLAMPIGVAGATSLYCAHIAPGE